MTLGSTAAIKNHPRMKDFVSWFEIPAYDIQRATNFYNAIYNMEMETNYNGEYTMSFFPADKGVGGAVVAGPGCIPNDTGVLIYLNVGNDLDSVLGRVELAGGRVIMPKTLISESAGYFALFVDSEGNRLALHEGSRSVTKGAKEAKAPARIEVRPDARKSKPAAAASKAKPAPGKRKR